MSAGLRPEEEAIAAMLRYYDARAPEYDETTYELTRSTAAGSADLDRLVGVLQKLRPALTLDVGCGTGWLTRFLRGPVVALDASEAMLRQARRRLPEASFVRAEVPPLPFEADSFERVFAANLYSHLVGRGARRAFVEEAFRVAPELVVIEVPPCGLDSSESWEPRVLGDGSQHRVYKRYATADALAAELGGQVLHSTSSFVAILAGRQEESARA